MKFSTSVALFALLASNVAAAPAIKTVYVTQYTTVLKKIAGPAAAKTETPVAEAPATTLTTETTSSTQETEIEQPTTTSLEAPQPETTTSTTSTSSTSSTEAPASTGSDEGDHAGQGTYYDTGLGACGITNVDTDFIVAVSKDLFDENLTDGNPNHNPLCGKKIRAFYQGKSVDVAITDRCVGCKYNDLDFSPAAFETIADIALGRIDITWEWL
ncbi:hypothetical protein G9P44_001531 [Scheffersomyces stipitis]|nr:hypothetical protein G9P44_001531 [Scheffersomyces stipitis]